jgi:hypothetical protein
MGALIYDCLHDEKINIEGLNYLDRAFRHSQAHEGGQVLLIGALKDERFINESRSLVTDLVAHIVLQDKS